MKRENPNEEFNETFVRLSLALGSMFLTIFRIRNGEDDKFALTEQFKKVDQICKQLYAQATTPEKLADVCGGIERILNGTPQEYTKEDAIISKQLQDPAILEEIERHLAHLNHWCFEPMKEKIRQKSK